MAQVLAVVSSLMQECWRSNPHARLTVGRVRKSLQMAQIQDNNKDSWILNGCTILSSCKLITSSPYNVCVCVFYFKQDIPGIVLRQIKLRAAMKRIQNDIMSCDHSSMSCDHEATAFDRKVQTLILRAR